MEYGDFIKSGIGAILGFLLAQFVNVARLIWDWWNRPKLVIEPVGQNCVLLGHGTEAGSGEIYDEEVYGFYVRNTGRRIATGVRVQLINIEYREHNWPKFADISEHAYDLALYKGAGRKSEDTEAVLVPEATVVIELARWREDYGTIFPAVSGLPDYYEEICALATEYRFTVVAFDDKAHFVRKILTVRYGSRHRANSMKATDA
jgi:hypothetical protein